jgi:murein DD-endopeptidase MepM/ murein hydrolase activator NlpD
MYNAIRSITNATKYLLSPPKTRIPIRVLRPYSKWLNNPMIPDFSRWHFEEGMRYGDEKSWWKNSVPRKEPHNGIDLYRYTSTNGCDRSITAGTPIAAFYGGEIAKIAKDKICYSVFVRHTIFTRGLQFYTIFGHIKVNEGLKEKDIIKAGTVLGEVANVPQGSHAFPHLHLSMAWIPKNMSPSLINWKYLDKRLFIDPIFWK